MARTYWAVRRRSFTRMDDRWRQTTAGTALRISRVLRDAGVGVSTFPFLKHPVRKLKHLEIQGVTDQFVVHKSKRMAGCHGVEERHVRWLFVPSDRHIGFEQRSRVLEELGESDQIIRIRRGCLEMNRLTCGDMQSLSEHLRHPSRPQ